MCCRRGVPHTDIFKKWVHISGGDYDDDDGAVARPDQTSADSEDDNSARDSPCTPSCVVCVTLREMGSRHTRTYGGGARAVRPTTTVVDGGWLKENGFPRTHAHNASHGTRIGECGGGHVIGAVQFGSAGQ